MHPELAEVNLKKVRMRIAEGDCPITPAVDVETLEFTLDEIADQRDRALKRVTELEAELADESTIGFPSRFDYRYDHATGRNERL